MKLMKRLKEIKFGKTAKIILGAVAFLGAGIFLVFNVRMQTVDQQVCFGTEGRDALLRAELTAEGNVLMLIEERKPVIWGPKSKGFPERVFLMKEVDQYGNEQAALYLTEEFAPEPYMNIRHVKNVHKTKDGGYLIVGTVESDVGRKTDPVTGSKNLDSNLWLLKLDKEGSIAWNHSGGDRQFNEYGSNAIETRNGDIFLLGTSQHSTTHKTRYVMLRLSGKDGTLKWRRFYPIAENRNRSYESVAVAETASGDIYVLGEESMDEGFLDYDLYLTKFNANGNLLWEKGLGKAKVPGYSGLYRSGSMALFQKEEAVVVCHTENKEDFLKIDVWAARVNPEGEYVWAEFLYEKANRPMFATSISVSQDNELLISGTKKDWRKWYGSEMWVAAMSDSGELSWTKSFGGSHRDIARAVFQAPDGHVVVVGTTRSNNGDVSGNHGYEDVWFATF